MPIQGVFPVDINTNPMTYTMPCTVVGPTGTTAIVGTYSASLGPAAPAALVVYAGQAQWNNVANRMEAIRTPMIYNHQLCTTVAATAVWTPAAGKKFRLMGYVICPDAGMGVAGIELITFLDSAAAITIAHQTYLPIAASIQHQTPIVVALPGNGYLSSAANNVLNVTLTTAVTAGAVSIFVYGTEE